MTPALAVGMPPVESWRDGDCSGGTATYGETDELATELRGTVAA